MHRVLAVSVGLFAALGVARAADPAPEEKTGPKVGEKAPEFTLKDQAGKERALKEMLKDGPVALVFYRSASW
jgi:cytochrome oxidase Cu insertion factor (SCO1/SenC/PrrC family)